MKWSSLLLVSISIITSYAAPLTLAELRQNRAKGLRLISLEEGVEPVWRTDDEVKDLIKADAGFFDVTDFYDPTRAAVKSSQREAATSYGPLAHGDHINALIGDVSIPNMQHYLANLTSFHTRYYKSETGAAASVWIRDTAQGFISAYPENEGSVLLFANSFGQSSIIARIPGSDADAPIVILGGHMDSITFQGPDAPAPGADDDGSGSVNLLETFRVLVSSGFKPKNTVEFHWYAGEEAGLLGSQAIARDYRDRNIAVKAMLQLDMTAYVRPGTEEVVALISDFVDPNLTTFLGSLVDAYLTIPWTASLCGYGCSDHASWNREGYPSAFPFEGIFSNLNPALHSAEDTVDFEGFSWSHMAEFTKLAIAFAVELASENPY